MSTLICSSIKPSYRVHRQTTKRRTRVAPITRSTPEPVQDIIIEYEEKPNPIPEYRFAEVLNGRAAMQGFLWGSMNWVMTGDNIIQQVEDPVYARRLGHLPLKPSSRMVGWQCLDSQLYWD
jgi:hypothetical protein